MNTKQLITLTVAMLVSVQAFGRTGSGSNNFSKTNNITKEEPGFITPVITIENITPVVKTSQKTKNTPIVTVVEMKETPMVNEFKTKYDKVIAELNNRKSNKDKDISVEAEETTLVNEETSTARKNSQFSQAMAEFNSKITTKRASAVKTPMNFLTKLAIGTVVVVTIAGTTYLVYKNSDTIKVYATTALKYVKEFLSSNNTDKTPVDATLGNTAPVNTAPEVTKEFLSSNNTDKTPVNATLGNTAPVNTSPEVTTVKIIETTPVNEGYTIITDFFADLIDFSGTEFNEEYALIN